MNKHPQLHDALAEAENSISKVIEFSRRYCSLREEAERLRREIGIEKLKREGHSPLHGKAVVPSSGGRPLKHRNRFLQMLFRFEREKIGEIVTHIDAICSVPWTNGIELRREGRTNLTVSGWAIPAGGHESFSAITVSIKAGETKLSVEALKNSRPDVAKHWSVPAFVDAGFVCEFVMSDIPPHCLIVLEVSAVDKLGKQFCSDAGNFMVL
jgi:hypothetical protein